MSGMPFAYDGPPALGEAVAAALRRVVDPEFALSIVDIGLVDAVALRGNELQVRVTMTSPACPVADVIVEDIEHELGRAVPAQLLIRVDVVWEPPWSADRMSAAARTFMGW